MEKVPKSSIEILCNTKSFQKEQQQKSQVQHKTAKHTNVQFNKCVHTHTYVSMHIGK